MSDFSGVQEFGALMPCMSMGDVLKFQNDASHRSMALKSFYISGPCQILDAVGFMRFQDGGQKLLLVFVVVHDRHLRKDVSRDVPSLIAHAKAGARAARSNRLLSPRR